LEKRDSTRGRLEHIVNVVSPQATEEDAFGCN
jgi:hypothetical protein